MKTDGSEVTQLSASDMPVMGGSWSPDDKYLAMSTNELTTKLLNQDIYLYNNETGDMKRVIQIKEGSQDNFADWAPDGKSFAFTSDASGVEQIGIYNLETEEIKWLGEGKSIEYGLKFSPSGKLFAVIRNHESTIKPFVYNIETGDCQELKIPEGLAFTARFLEEDKLIFYYTAAKSRGEVWIYDLNKDTYKVLLAAEYGSIDPKRFVEPEYIKYKTDDGTLIPAIMYKPANIPDGVKLPAVVNVHGGPTGQFFRAFDVMGQYVSSEGIVFINPNVRGSTGYGVEFRDSCIKDWGGKDLQDVVYAKKYLESLPYVDPNRIGVGGGSYGGFMTFIAVT
ncbi:MAG: S9 family peptidase, partial [Candidatus Heimdallarchaeota archaeon]